MIRVGIVGATGYAGAEIAGLLLGHPQAEVVFYGSKSYAGQKFSAVYGNFRNLIEEKYDICREPDLPEMAKECDVIFTATPQGYLSGLLTPEILENTKVIDLSADYRLKDIEVYKPASARSTVKTSRTPASWPIPAVLRPAPFLQPILSWLKA